MLLNTVLEKAVAEGHTLIAYSETPHEPDYTGRNAKACKDALEACDEMHCEIRSAEGRRIAWLFIVNDADGDPEEQISDCSDNTWIKQFGEEEI